MGGEEFFCLGLSLCSALIFALLIIHNAPDETHKITPEFIAYIVFFIIFFLIATYTGIHLGVCCFDISCTTCCQKNEHVEIIQINNMCELL